MAVVDTCPHDPAYEIEAPDGGGGAGCEVVCGRCGVVKTEDMMIEAAAGGGRAQHQHQHQRRQGTAAAAAGTGTEQQPEPEPPAAGASADAAGGGGYERRLIPTVPGHAAAAAAAGSAAYNGAGGGSCRPNLYLELEVGGKPDHTLRGDRYVHRQTDLAAVSNIAQKLGVPNNVSMTVWQWYRRLRKELDLTKAKCLVLSFYGVCRYMGCPISEDKLAECIKMELGVRHARPYLRVIMEASSYMEGGEMVLRRCGFLNLVGDVDLQKAAGPRAGRNGGGDNLKFALGSEMQELAGQYGPDAINHIMGEAKRLLPALTTRVKNPKRAARMAVQMARHRVSAAGRRGAD